MRAFTLAFAAAMLFTLNEPVWWQWSLWLAGMGCVIVLLWQSSIRRCALVGLGCGAVVAFASVAYQFSLQLEPHWAGVDLTVTGRVVGVPKHQGRSTSFVFEIDQLLDAKVKHTIEAHQTPTRVRRVSLSWYGLSDVDMQSGDRWLLTVRLKPPSGLGNDGGFDYARWLFQSRIQARGYVRDKSLVRLLERSHWRLDALRERLSKRITELPSANEFSALVVGLAVGLTSNVSDQQWQLLRDSGTAHLLAISGLHIGLISGWAYLLTGLFWRLLARYVQLPPKVICCAVVGVVGAFLYAMLAGLSLPTQRAVMMLLVAAIGLFCRRIWPANTVLHYALLAVLLIDPLAMLSAGFWLSFGTVSALCYLHMGRLKQGSGVLQGMRVHLQLGIILLPASAWFFQTGSMVAPLANAVAVPVVGFVVVPLSLFSLLLSWLWPALGELTLACAQWILQWLLTFLEWVLALPAATLDLSISSVAVLCSTMIGLLLLFAPRGLPIRWLCIPLLLPSLTLNVLGPVRTDFELHVLDVGQGLAVLVFTREHTLLFDTGNKVSGDSSMVERVVEPFLISKGRRKIDAVVISHADSDHAAGLNRLLDTHPNLPVMASAEENMLGSQARHCYAGDSWVWDNVSFAFVHPAKGDVGSENNLSCVLLLHFGKSRVLLSGDIEAPGERTLLDRMGRFPVTVLVAPHHGSKTSSSEKWVESLQPQHVVFPAGYRNRFGFPHQDVQMRYNLSGSIAHITGVAGAISFVFDRKGLQQAPVSYWQRHRRFWNAEH